MFCLNSISKSIQEGKLFFINASKGIERTHPLITVKGFILSFPEPYPITVNSTLYNFTGFVCICHPFDFLWSNLKQLLPYFCFINTSGIFYCVLNNC